MRHFPAAMYSARLQEGVAAPRVNMCASTRQHHDVSISLSHCKTAAAAFLYLVCIRRITAHSSVYLSHRLCPRTAAPSRSASLCTYGTCPRRCFPRALPAADWSARRTNESARPAEAGPACDSGAVCQTLVSAPPRALAPHTRGAVCRCAS